MCFPLETGRRSYHNMMKVEWGPRNCRKGSKEMIKPSVPVSLLLAGKLELALKIPGKSPRETTTEERGLPPLEGKTNP